MQEEGRILGKSKETREEEERQSGPLKAPSADRFGVAETCFRDGADKTKRGRLGG